MIFKFNFFTHNDVTRLIFISIFYIIITKFSVFTI